MFKNLFLKLRTYFAKKKQVTVRRSVSFKDAQSIGVVIQNEDLNNSKIINNFVGEIKNLGKKVDVLFVEKSKGSVKANFDFKSLNNKDITWNGLIKSERVQRFMEKDFDFLYSLNLNSNIPTQNIFANSKAKYRVGNHEVDNEGLFELMIDTQKKPKLEILADQMLFYSKNI